MSFDERTFDELSPQAGHPFVLSAQSPVLVVLCRQSEVVHGLLRRLGEQGAREGSRVRGKDEGQQRHNKGERRGRGWLPTLWRHRRVPQRSAARPARVQRSAGATNAARAIARSRLGSTSSVLPPLDAFPCGQSTRRDTEITRCLAAPPAEAASRRLASLLPLDIDEAVAG